MLKRIRAFINQEPKYDSPTPILTAGQWWQGEIDLESLRDAKCVARNELPPGASREWTSRYGTESTLEYLARTKWTKCYSCADWYKRSICCSHCGESNQIYPACPHCQARIRSLPEYWRRCQTCNAALSLEKTMKSKA